MQYVELHCHSNYSFQEGASFIHELLASAKEMGCPALALTDHDNLCGAMEFARNAHSLDIQPITGVEASIKGGYHLTILAETPEGYANLCWLLSIAKLSSNSKESELELSLLTTHSKGLIFLTGCRKGYIPCMAQQGNIQEAENALRCYVDWFGSSNVFIELQQNFVKGDTQRNQRLADLGSRLGVDVVATNNVHYHTRERHQLHDALVSLKNLKTLDETHRQRRANSEFYLKSSQEMTYLFREYPEAITNTMRVAERCLEFDITKDLGYRLPESPIPEGFTQEAFLRCLCEQAAVRLYGSITTKVNTRLDEEFRLIRRHNIAGFLLVYYDIIQLAHQVQIDIGAVDPGTPIWKHPPGRGRGSSVAMLVGYLIGLSHIDPLQFNLSLERFLPDDDITTMPDIDLDFPRDIREELIKQVHDKYGFEHAALIGMISTYKRRGAIRAVGKVLELAPDLVDKLAKRSDPTGARSLTTEISAFPEFRHLVDVRGWRDLIRLVGQLEGFPKYLAQHPSGMVISSKCLTSMVPVQPGVMANRYIMQWDKDSISDAGFVKIDFLALGVLSQMEETLNLIELRKGYRPDLSRINFRDEAVYEMICSADTIGVFQVESPAQMQTTPRLRPKNLFDLAHEVGAVRPGVGVNDGITQYILRRQGKLRETYEHPLERKALERTRGVILFQDQVNQLAVDVGGLSPLDADQLRKTCGRRNKSQMMYAYWEKFRDGAARKGVDKKTAERIFKKFNGYYMFPESHAFAFGVTVYQSAWLKFYYPLEFYVGIFNQQPMGFYNPETLKEDAKRHGVNILNPDVNLSKGKCTTEDYSIRLGFRYVAGIGLSASEAISNGRNKAGGFTSIACFMEHTGLKREELDNLADAGAFDSLVASRRAARWEIGLRYRPVGEQLSLALPVRQDMAFLPQATMWECMNAEYRAMGVHPPFHVMAYMRETLPSYVKGSSDVIGMKNKAQIFIAGLVIRRQRPLRKVVFVTLEDEWGHTSLIIRPKIYKAYRQILEEPFVIAMGNITRRNGTVNVLVSHVFPMKNLEVSLIAKDWI
ncbi:DNA polymerase III subunit alpha [Dehalococcoidia bacterium]|nr:DNA polymerase III subunit alpha [Dehalococcoidia bacterium]